MGVPGYFKSLIKRNKSLLSSVKEKILFEYLFMDYNNIIHTASQDYLKKNKSKLKSKTKAQIENEIIEHVINKTINIFKIVKPLELFYIAMDGVPPRAKMEQQRLRRHKKILENELDYNLKKKYKMDTKIYFDSNVISPGTLFMKKLSKKLQKSIDDGLFGNKIHIILSDSSVIGEGEHKIIPYIKKYIKNGNICIYGDDADLIFLSMSLLTNEINIKIMKSQSLENTEYEKTGLAYLDVSKISNNFYNFINIKNANKNRILYDYIFMMILFGDDFVKKIPSLEIDKHSDFLLELYKNNFSKYHSYLISINENEKKIKINKPFFKHLLFELKKIEERSLLQSQKYIEHTCNKNFKPKDPDLKGYELDKNILYHSFICQNENPFYNEYKDDFNKIDYELEQHIYKRQYYSHFFNDITENMENQKYNEYRSKICKTYLESIIFTIEYYLFGVPSYSFYYPYRVAPFISDLFTNVKYIKILEDTSYKLDKPYTPLEQLLIIMPKEFKSMLPKLCKEIISSKKFQKYYNYEKKLDVLADKKFFKTELLLPEINDIEILNEFNNKYKNLNNSEKNRDSVTKELYYHMKKKINKNKYYKYNKLKNG